MTNDATPPLGQFILFQTDEGQTQVECRFETETLWLTQNLIAELYQKTVPTINEHLSNIYSEGELEQNATIRNFRIVQIEGAREVARDVTHYNLEAILAVGYRVRSKQGMLFRQWATKTLQEYLTKGFVMDDERLKNPDNMQYFDELLNRIRDIRSSEKIFWRKVCDIYATSIDYDGKAQTSVDFFAKIQNKMHWAAHGNTAAELVFKRIDADKPHLGLTSFAGTEPTRKEVVTGKNYLDEKELDTLNRLVNSYLEFAELQARNGKLMKMADWASKLDDFLRLSDYEVLNHAGHISQAQATEKAKQEYDKYRRVIDAQPSKVDVDLANALKQLQNKQPQDKPNN
ncbi:virulence RhuM family protein [Shewanella livingstonensis]|uniref:Hydroxyacid dehydrogenase n=1 Tax=Shewanella livingstonensis TaxID=150120 RepID=A0A3G8LQE0_9GAMM|nr:virulence RhuM family protein [Shewanella livingstonensis]AZG71749.1 hydroxyacid dehydrogenase [Shewanella livingstonensis]